MLNPKQIEEVVVKLSQSIPEGVGQIPENLKAQLRATLTASLEKLDLVSREEFDVQSQVLAKTRQKLDAMEKTVAELERRLVAEDSTDSEF
jgi:hypothetical protein